MMSTDDIEETRVELERMWNPIKELDRPEFIKTLPDLTRRRISALKKIQMDYLEAESKFYEEIHKIACKLQDNLKVLHDKRNEIVNGELTPNDEDLCECDEVCDISNSIPNPPDFVDNGIPDFWLTVLKCGKLTADLIQPPDEIILQQLTNIRVVMNESPPMGFTLEFLFAPNKYFTNKVLTKTYYLKFDLDKDDPFSYEGPEINKSKGCTIDWVKGNNVTIKTVRKRQKHKAAPMTRTIVKSVKVLSFFNFFTPPKIPSDPEMIDEKLEEELDFDFEIGHYLKERLIPRAVLFYTGEGIEDESSYEDSDEECETDEEYPLYIKDENDSNVNATP